MILNKLISILGLATVTFATKGLDVSSYTSESAFKCLKSSGFEFVIVRGFQSNGHVDRNAVSTIKNARAAGFKFVDAYLFPCFHCGNPASQAASTVKNLVDNGAEVGMIWVDVEAKQLWGSVSENVNFLVTMVNEVKKYGKGVGIYSSEYNWQGITGNSHSFTSFGLWYAHYDNRASLSDWGYTSFGGWKLKSNGGNVEIKQYGENYKACGVNYDPNYY